ncbi:MAG: DUF1850 domain-containing protein [Oscillospiraceae bacterium]
MPACLLLIVVIVLSGAPLIPPSLVVVSEGRVLFEQVIGPTECEVDFRHSVNKGLIREVYRIDPDHRRITLERSYNQSFGAGMLDTVPDTEGLNFHQEGDYYRMDFPVNWQSEIRYIGGSIAGHTFVYDGKTLDLGAKHPRKAFIISVERRSLLGRLLHTVH